MEATAQQGNWQKQWGLLVAKAWSDAQLKTRLIEQPLAVLQEHGIDVPADMEFKVVEDTDKVYHLILPAAPSGELVDEELSSSLGFDSWCGGCCGRCGCGCRDCFQS